MQMRLKIGRPIKTWMQNWRQLARHMRIGCHLLNNVKKMRGGYSFIENNNCKLDFFFTNIYFNFFFRFHDFRFAEEDRMTRSMWRPPWYPPGTADV